MAARILIMTSNSMETVDQASVQRMCRNAIALQQTLSSISATREIALEAAKNFYEMLYMDPEVCITRGRLCSILYSHFVIAGDFSKYYRKRCTIHGDAILERIAIVM